MTETPPAIPRLSDLEAWMQAIHQALKRYSDKDWNYSRISLAIKDLQQLSSSYALMIEWIDVRGKLGLKEYQTIMSELTWGNRHSHELGVLEIASLRINFALSQITSNDYWHGIRPVIRVQSKSALAGFTHAFWYQVEEVDGEEFENR
jgi:hypothetical protein